MLYNVKVTHCYLWLIKVLNRDVLIEGNVSLSWKIGFASINLLSSITNIFRADLVSPYFDNCAFSLNSSTMKKKYINSQILNQQYHII